MCVSSGCNKVANEMQSQSQSLSPSQSTSTVYTRTLWRPYGMRKCVCVSLMQDCVRDVPCMRIPCSVSASASASSSLLLLLLLVLQLLLLLLVVLFFVAACPAGLTITLWQFYLPTICCYSSSGWSRAGRAREPKRLCQQEGRERISAEGNTKMLL